MGTVWANKNGTCTVHVYYYTRSACTCESTCTGTLPVPVGYHAASIKTGTCTCTECACYVPLFIYYIYCGALRVSTGTGHAYGRLNSVYVSCPIFVLLVVHWGSYPRHKPFLLAQQYIHPAMFFLLRQYSCTPNSEPFRRHPSVAEPSSVRASHSSGTAHFPRESRTTRTHVASNIESCWYSTSEIFET